MFATTSPRLPPRRDSTGSFNSNPDADLNSNEGHDHPRGLGGDNGDAGGLRVPTPHPATPSRPPRDELVRQSLRSRSVRNSPHPSNSLGLANGPPRGSFIPYSEFGYNEPVSRATTRPPTQYPTTYLQPPVVSHGGSYVDVDENMVVSAYYGGQGQGAQLEDEEVVRRGDGIRMRMSRPSRLKRFANALLRPFKSLKSAIPKLFSKFGRKLPTTPTTNDSGWHFRDRTPAATSVANQYSNEAQDVTILFTESQTVPAPTVTTMPEPSLGHDHDYDHDHGHGHRSSGGTDSAHGHSATQHSHSRIHSPAPSHGVASPRSELSRDRGTIKPIINGNAIQSPRTIHTHTSPSTHTSFSLQPNFRSPRPRASDRPLAKEVFPHSNRRSRSSRVISSISNCSSLLHHFAFLFHGLKTLYHLPWMASPPKRVALDFIPAYSSRSKYRARVQKDEARPYPRSVIAAAKAAQNMEPSEGKSWYTPSPQQIEKMEKKDNASDRRHHHHHHRHPYEQINLPTLMNGYAEGQPAFRYGHNNQLPLNVFTLPPSFPQPQMPQFGSSVPGAFYIVPGPPPPAAGAPPPVNRSPSQVAPPGANGNGLRAPAAARPSSVKSTSRHSSRGVRPGNNNGVPNQPHQAQMHPPDPNPSGAATMIMPRGPEIQRPTPAAQTPQMYMLVHAPPLPPPHQLPPSYASGVGVNVYPYPYTPPWSTPSQRV